MKPNRIMFIVGTVITLILIAAIIILTASCIDAINDNSSSAITLLIFTIIASVITGIVITTTYAEKQLDEMQQHPSTNREWIETLDDESFLYVLTHSSPCDLCTEHYKCDDIPQPLCEEYLLDWLHKEYTEEDNFVKLVKDKHSKEEEK